MKKLLTLFLGASLFTTTVSSQCTPDATVSTPGYYTSAGEGKMPEAEIDIAYDETITVLLFSSVDILGRPVTVDSAILLNVTSIPSGLTYKAKDTKILGGGKTCIQVSGTPNNPGEVGTQKIILDIDAYGLNGNKVNRKEELTLKINKKGTTTPASIQQVISTSFSAFNAPNPFYPTTNFTMHKVESKRVNFEVFNMLGKKVYANSQIILDSRNSFEFDASELPGGLYIYQLSDGENTKVDRIVIASH